MALPLRPALARSLSLHFGVETCVVDHDTTLAGDLLRELQREAVRVVQQEGRAAGQRLSVLAELVLEDDQAGLQRLTEALLLASEHVDDEVAVGQDVGVGIAHHIDSSVDQRGHDEPLGAQQVGVPNRTADDAAQHVPAVLVAGEHAVAHQHRGRASVLGQHAHGEAVAIVVVASAVAAAGEAAGLIDERLHQRCLPHRIHALQQAQHALEPEPGVDAGLRQQRA